jgi:hypothetical protein
MEPYQLKEMSHCHVKETMQHIIFRMIIFFNFRQDTNVLKDILVNRFNFSNDIVLSK